jgi:tetratricopeptide (TPR) repeat protein
MRYFTIGILLFASLSATCQKIDWDYFGEAVEYQKQKKYSEAIRIYSELLEVDSNIYGCWNNRGQCFYEMAEYNYALFDFYKAVNLIQSDSSLFLMIGLTHIYLEQWEKGIEFLNYAEEQGFPRNETYYQNLGSCYYFLGQNDSAIYYLSKSHTINPKSHTTLTNLAFSYINTEPEKSCTYFQQAYQLDSLNPRRINNLGYSHFLCGNLDNAFDLYQRALSLEPKNAYIHRNIGLYYKSIDNKELACKSLEDAIALGFITDWGESDISELLEYCNK